jgi:hypothetical protein
MSASPSTRRRARARSRGRSAGRRRTSRVRRSWFSARGIRHLSNGQVEGEDPLASFSPTAARHLERSDAFAHAPDLFVNSFYDSEVDEGCAFEELISFHGGMGGPQTRPFILAPVELPLPDSPIVGAAEVHRLLKSWRHSSEVVPETS